ncbi:UNVERIFIED_CONTAM: hypothetical protein GTU68_053204 [Idotea baltica]|nr:hypothetical protein [Idotea baltica]
MPGRADSCGDSVGNQSKHVAQENR